MRNNTLKITYAGALLAISILLPMVFHTILGGVNTGPMFLPMHIPVLLAGFILGPVYGLFIGILAPLINALTTGMPSMVRLPFMIVELGIYGLSTGLIYHKLSVRNRKYGIYITLGLAMLIGRLMYAGTIFVLVDLLGIPLEGTATIATIFAAAVTGIYGIIIQILVIPLILYLLQKGGLLDGLSKGSN